MSVFVGPCVLKEWFMGGAGLDKYFAEQGLPMGMKDVLKDFTEDALTISAGSLFKNEAARMTNANWRRRVQHLCWWNL